MVVGAKFAFDFDFELFASRFRQGFDEAGAEHVQPVAQAALAIVKRRWAVEQDGVSGFESVFFQQAGVLGDAGVIPGMRSCTRQV